jgi:hypothetical protein
LNALCWRLGVCTAVQMENRFTDSRESWNRDETQWFDLGIDNHLGRKPGAN